MILRVLIRLAIFSLQALAFVAGVYASTLGLSYYLAKTYAENQNEIPDEFPLLVNVQEASDNAEAGYAVVRWSESQPLLIEEARKPELFPNGTGKAMVKGRRSLVFKFTIEGSNEEKLINLLERRETGIIYWRYALKNREVVSLYRRSLGYASAVVGLIPGILLASLVGWGCARAATGHVRPYK